MDLGNYLRFIAALLFVLGLIALATWLARRFGLGGKVTPLRGRSRRLRVVEVTTIDSKHRAVLIRRDDVEHMVMIGPNNDILIETGIDAPAESETPSDDEVAPAGKVTT
jgi:flagellar protein FliO/FliZ